MKITSAEFIKGIRGTDSILDDGKKQIAFIGRSNVGKSSLINYLVDRKSLVKSSSKPGKTREVNFFLVNKEFYFVDLPGYGYAKMSHTDREKLRKLIMWYVMDTDIDHRTLVIVIDARIGVTEFDQEIMDSLDEHEMYYLLAVNKTDKLNQKEKHALQKDFEASEHDYVFVSAIKKRGKDDLYAACGL